MQKNKTKLDSEISLFRNNVESYSEFFIHKLKLQFIKMNSSIQVFKESLFVENKGSFEGMFNLKKNDKQKEFHNSHRNYEILKKKKTAEFPNRSSNFHNIYGNDNLTVESDLYKGKSGPGKPKLSKDFGSLNTANNESRGDLNCRV